MAEWTVTINASLPASYNWLALRDEIAAAFGAAFVDCSVTDYGAAVQAFLKTSSAGDGATLAGVVAAHNPATLTAAQQEAAAREVDFAALKSDIASAITYFQGNYDGWAGLTAAQKDANHKNVTLSVIKILKSLRYLAR